jgi:hypothetical protein
LFEFELASDRDNILPLDSGRSATSALIDVKIRVVPGT